MYYEWLDIDLLIPHDIETTKGYAYVTTNSHHRH